MQDERRGACFAFKAGSCRSSHLRPGVRSAHLCASFRKSEQSDTCQSRGRFYNSGCTHGDPFVVRSRIGPSRSLGSQTVISLGSFSLIAEEKRMYTRFAKSVCRVLVLAVVALAPVALVAQGSAKPAVKGYADDSASKWDIFLGYSALIPNARVNQYGYNAIDYGAIGSVTRYFNRHAGLQFEVDEHVLLPENRITSTSEPGDDFDGGSVGGVYRFPSGNFTPFVHALFGIEQVGSYY